MEDKLQQEYNKLSDNIVKIILKYVPDSEAILYIGSFGKKEMGYIITEDNNIQFLNDCDVMFITRKRAEPSTIKLLRDKLSKMANKDYVEFEDAVNQDKYYNFYVDPRNMTLEDLKKITSRIKYYDIFNNPNLLYIKDDTLLELFPKIDLNKIPLEDGLVHLFNRMALLIEFSPHIIKDPNVQLIFVAKAYSAILESLLLYNGNYVSSYRAMASKFRYTYCMHEELCLILPGLEDRASHFIDIKTDFHPHYNKYGIEDIIPMWEQAKIDIIYTTIYLINKIYKKEFGFSIDIDNIIKIIKFLESNNRFVIYPYVKSKPLLRFVPMKIIQTAINLKFFNKYYGPIFSIEKSFKIPTDITSCLYCLTLLSLASLNYNGQDNDFKNNGLYFIPIDKCTYIIPIELVKIKKIEDFLKIYATIFRQWEAFVFEL